MLDRNKPVVNPGLFMSWRSAYHDVADAVSFHSSAQFTIVHYDSSRDDPTCCQLRCHYVHRSTPHCSRPIANSVSLAVLILELRRLNLLQ